MSGKKSLEQIWQQIQSQREAEAQRQAVQERALYEQREIARQEYLKRMRMFESSTVNTSSSSAGAGGGRLIKSDKVQLSLSGGKSLFYIESGESLSYFVYDFEMGIKTDIYTISKDNSNVYFGYYISSNDGLFLLYNFNGDEQNIYRIGIDGSYTIIPVTINTNRYSYGNYHIVEVINDDSSVDLHVFKGELYRKYSFEDNVDIGFMKSGFYVRIDNNGVYNLYVVSGIGDLVLVDSFGTNLSVYTYIDRVSDLIIQLYEDELNLYNVDGIKIYDYVLNLSFQYVHRIYFIGGGFVLALVDDNDYNVLFYSAISNTITNKIISRTNNNVSFYFSEQKNIYNQDNFINDGVGLIGVFNNSSDYINTFDYHSEISFLPIWDSDSSIRDFYIYTDSDVKGIKKYFDDDELFFIADSNSICMLVDNGVGDEYNVLRLNRVDNVSDEFTSTIKKDYILEDEDRVDNFIVFNLRENINKLYGFDDLSNLEDRIYLNLRPSLDNRIGDNIIGTEIIMSDVQNNQYYKFIFTNWGSNNGQFAYTRELIVGGTGSGDIVSFDRSLDGSTDVIVPGVIELTRGNSGPLYNSVTEQSSNSDISPAGTLWNSEYSFKYNNIFKSFNGLGNNIDTLVIDNNNYDTDDEGGLYVISDYDNDNTYYLDSNLNWVELGKYYDVSASSNYTTNTGVNKCNFILYDGNNYRIFKDSIISEEFIIDIVDYNKLVYHINKNNLIIEYGNYISNWVIYNIYDLNNILLDSITIENINHSYNICFENIFAVGYSIDDIFYVTLFNGNNFETISFDTNANNRYYVLNDWHWWDD